MKLACVWVMLLGCLPAIPAMAQSTVPPRVINWEHLPPVGRQSDRARPGLRGETHYNCQKFHISYYCMTATKARAMGWLRPDPATHPERVMSPDWPEYVTHTAWNVHGCATLADMATERNEAGWPTRDQWQAALRNRTWRTEQIIVSSPAEIDALRARLASGEVAMIGLMSTPSLQGYGNNTEPLPGISGDVFFSHAGLNGVGHALTVIGYDDAKPWTDAGGNPHQGAFIAVNSWGTDWGVELPEVGTRGFIWLAYDFFIEAQIGATLLINRPEETPRALAVIQWQHPLAHQVVMDVMAGRPLDPNWTERIILGSFNLPIDVEIVMDVTPAIDQGAHALWLRTQTADFIEGGTPAAGTVSRFALEIHDAPEPWECSDVPAATVPLGSLSDPQWLWLSAGLLEDEGEAGGDPPLGDARQVWGDFNGDGVISGVVHGSEFTGSEFLYRTHRLLVDEQGGIVTQPSGLPEEDLEIASGDINRDGRLDLLTFSRTQSRMQAWTLSLYSGRFVELPIALPAVNLDSGQMGLIDFNSDGRLDLATYAWEGTSDDPIAFRLWMQQSDGGFTDSGIRLALNQISAWPTMAWGDIDGDGWIDVALTATVEGEERVSLLRNTGGQGLAPMGDLPSHWDGPFAVRDVPRGMMAFGDANSDGRADLALGMCNSVHLNRGGGAFDRIALGPAYASGRSTIQWIDIDNDGDSDLITSGDNGVVRDFFLDVWLNSGAETFTSAIGTLPGLARGSIAAVDLEGDGDADLVAAGHIERIGGLQEYTRTLRVFRNRAAQTSGLARVNQPPQRPAAPSIEPDGGMLRVHWTPPEDDRTPSASLLCNLRIETFPGWDDIISGTVGEDVLANRFATTTALASNLPAGPLHCRVQAVDSGGRRSAWSEPALIDPSALGDACDVNRDGQLDAADAVALDRAIAGESVPAGWRRDIDGDGAATLADGQFIIQRLLGADLPGPDLAAVETIGASGGRIQADGFDLEIPAGQFDTPTLVSVRRLETERPEGANSISPTFHVTGLPPNGLTSFTLRLRADSPITDPPLLALGMEGESTSGGGRRRGAVHFAPTQTQGEWVTYAVALSSAPTVQSASLQWGVVEGWFGLTTGKAMVTSEHFQAVFPFDHDFVAIAQLMDALEAAHTRFHDEMLFSYASMPAGRIQVEVLNRGANEYGSFLNLPGTAFDKLEFNARDIVRDGPFTTVTAHHEFAHCVQAQFADSTRRDTYWLDEASAVWVETVARPGFLSPVYDTNSAAAFRGMIAGRIADAEAHGYGMASLMRYIESRKIAPLTATSQIWHLIGAGRDVPDAILDGLGGSDFTWYTDYLESLVLSQLYPYNHVDLDRDAPTSRTLNIAAMNLDHPVAFRAQIPNLGGLPHQTHVNRAGLPADAVLSHRLTGSEHLDLSGMRFEMLGTSSLIGRGSHANGATRLDLPIGSWTPDLSNRLRAVSLITNREGGAALTGQTQADLRMAVTWNRTYPMPSAPAVNANVHRGIPRFQISGSLEGPGLTSVTMTPLENLDGQGNSAGTLATATLMGQSPLTLFLQFNAALTDDRAVEIVSVTAEETIVREYTVTGVDHFRLVLHSDPSLTQPEILTSADGRFSIPIEPTREFLSSQASVVYDVNIATYVNGELSSTLVETGCTTNVGGLFLVF